MSENVEYFKRKLQNQAKKVEKQISKSIYEIIMMIKTKKKRIHFECVKCIEPMKLVNNYGEEGEDWLLFLECSKCGCKISFNEVIS